MFSHAPCKGLSADLNLTSNHLALIFYWGCEYPLDYNHMVMIHKCDVCCAKWCMYAACTIPILSMFCK